MQGHGGYGGGAIKIKSKFVELNGDILVNGESASQVHQLGAG